MVSPIRCHAEQPRGAGRKLTEMDLNLAGTFPILNLPRPVSGLLPQLFARSLYAPQLAGRNSTLHLLPFCKPTRQKFNPNITSLPLPQTRTSNLAQPWSIKTHLLSQLWCHRWRGFRFTFSNTFANMSRGIAWLRWPRRAASATRPPLQDAFGVSSSQFATRPCCDKT